VLVGPALQHLSFAEVVGAYYVAGAAILALGALGWVRRAMRAVPMPIVMAMVAGVFLRFGLGVVQSLHEDIALAGPMVAAWLLLSALPAWGRRLPPLIGALLVGLLATWLLHRMADPGLGALEFVRPVLQKPAWSWAAMVELVLPLMITVLVVQNGQGVAVLRAAGHQPPINALTVACGVGSLLSAMVGAVSSCLAGPTNAIVSASGERVRQYTAGLFTGLLAMVFGLFAPAFTRLMLHLPPAYVATLAGLAMLRVLQGAFSASFSGRFTLGALIALLVTVADRPLFGVGSAFWGLVAGLAVSWCLERGDFEAFQTGKV
jgi:benzoate membrane transport protein